MFPSWKSAVPEATKQLFSAKWKMRNNKKDEDSDGGLQTALDEFNFDETFSVSSLREYLSRFADQMHAIEKFGTILFVIEITLVAFTFLFCSLRGNTLLVKYIVSYRSMRTGVMGGRSGSSINSNARDNAAVMGVFQIAKYLRLSDPAKGAPFAGWNLLYMYLGLAAALVLLIDLCYGVYLWSYIKSEVIWSNYYFLPKFETTEHNNNSGDGATSLNSITKHSIDKFRRRKIRNILNTAHMSALYAYTYSRYKIVLGSCMRDRLSSNLRRFLNEKMVTIQNLFESEFRRIKSEEKENGNGDDNKAAGISKDESKPQTPKIRKDGSSDLPLLDSMQTQWEFEGTSAIEEFIINRDSFRPFHSDTLESLFECLHMQIMGIFMISYLVSAGLLFVYIWLILFAVFSVVSMSLFQFNMAGANGFSFMMVPIALMLLELCTFAFVASVGFIKAYGFSSYSSDDSGSDGFGVGSLIAVGAIVPIHILIVSSLFWKK